MWFDILKAAVTAIDQGKSVEEFTESARKAYDQIQFIIDNEFPEGEGLEWTESKD